VWGWRGGVGRAAGSRRCTDQKHLPKPETRTLNPKPEILNQVLGVPRGAGDAQIKIAYRKLAIQYHPDKTSGDPELEEKFKEISAGNHFSKVFYIVPMHSKYTRALTFENFWISAAYTVLSDPNKRRQVLPPILKVSAPVHLPYKVTV
jgi:hypothetical protein